jgi:guanylate kinase
MWCRENIIMQTKGTLWIISAPSGGGKTSLVTALLAQDPELTLSISHTTRAPREGETHGKNYFFVDEATFLSEVKQDTFLEHAQVFQHWYGTSRQWVLTQLSLGKDVILEIDWQGAQTIRQQMPCQSIFILPPSRAVLQSRLEGRQQDSPATIQSRLSKASEEISHYGEYDFLVVNDQFEEALGDLKAIIRANRLTLERQKMAQAASLSALISEE